MLEQTVQANGYGATLTLLDGPCPCDYYRFAARCGVENIACNPFSLYVRGCSESALMRRAPTQTVRAAAYRAEQDAKQATPSVKARFDASAER